MSAPAVAAVREHQILFRGPLVRAILDGRKSQTRRVVKASRGGGSVLRVQPAAHTPHYWSIDHARGTSQLDGWVGPSPFGAPGDRLWVREAIWLRESDGIVVYDADRAVRTAHGSLAEQMGITVLPANEKMGAYDNEALVGFGFRRRSSRFMPRWASRLTLEVTGVRVERVRDICSTDARAEGLDLDGRESYRDLWDSLNKARGYGWDVNPWVFVIDFTRVVGEGR